MKRGEIWTVSDGPDYAGKPRPCLIVQSDRFAINHSVTVCGFTTSPAEASILRPAIEPSEANGLRVACRIMTDKITTVPRAKLGQRIGLLPIEDMDRVGQAMLLFLGFGG